MLLQSTGSIEIVVEGMLCDNVKAILPYTIAPCNDSKVYYNTILSTILSYPPISTVPLLTRASKSQLLGTCAVFHVHGQTHIGRARDGPTGSGGETIDVNVLLIRRCCRTVWADTKVCNIEMGGTLAAANSGRSTDM